MPEAQYTYNANEKQQLMKDGEYEVRIERMEERVTKNGKQNLSIMFRVRDDVDQQYKNKCIFETIWRDKNKPECYNTTRINQLLGTQNIENGRGFANIKEIIDELLGSFLIVVIGTAFDDYRGEDVNKIRFYRSSKQSIAKAEVTNQNYKAIKAANEIEDTDLPF